MTALVAQSLAKTYPRSGGGDLTVLRDATFTLQRGDSAAVLGPSGSGKSTLLALLGALDRPSSGSLRLDGIDPYALSEPELADFRSKHVGFVFQEHHLLPQCSVIENILVPFLADGSASTADIESAQRLIDRVGLSERANHRPAELSGGERQRAALARALIKKPTLLLADEPTGNLDRSTADATVGLLLELQREHNAILVAVTHSPALAERMNRRYELDGGRLVEIQ
jgi:lipoprotein-releasing system ATP-binding protein